jgi:protein-S-isoprenylcysteine O-methyltransferase Ste14
MVSNRFFSTAVRIQLDRGHVVETGGPYRYVRHPGYVGAIVGTFALVLGSLWALLPGVVLAVLFVVRTALEDRTLRRKLPGYEVYAGRVRYRLVPGVW